MIHYSSLLRVRLVSSPPTSTTLFSSRVGNVCYFVTPEGVHSSTLLSSPGSLSPVHPMPATSMSLYKSLNQKPYDDGHLYAALIRSAAGGCPELPPWIHSPHSRPTTASRQQRERCPPLCIEYSQLCSLHSSCQQVFHFQCQSPWRDFYFKSNIQMQKVIKVSKGENANRKSVRYPYRSVLCIQKSHWTGCHYFHR